MDPLAQGIFGASLAQCFSVPRSGGKEADLRHATWAGALAGMAPDLDVLIRSSSDPLLELQFHRHFTHSLAFIPLGALIVCLFLWPFYLRGPVSFLRLYRYCLLGYATHGLLDACTSYGTHLLWPFSEARTSWDIIAIVDPFLEVPFLALTALAHWRRSFSWARLGFFLALTYLFFGLFQRERAHLFYEKVAQERGHAPARMQVRPTIGNLSLWRGIYEHQGEYFVDAVWVWPGYEHKLYPGRSIKKVDIEADFPFLERDSRPYRDMKRFEHFSANALAFHPEKKDVIADIRYSLMPNETRPLWGIRVDLARPDEHVQLEFFRDFNPRTPEGKEMLTRFVQMALGR